MPGRYLEALGLDKQDCPVCLAALIYLRWADFQEAEQEAVAAFDDASFEPILPASLHWRTWHALPANHLRTFLLEQLTPALERLNNTRHNTLATNLHRLAPALRKLKHAAPDALAGLVLWLADQPFETPTDRRALLGTFDSVLEKAGVKPGGWIGIPDRVARLMVELAAPVAGDRVYDPCFGFAGLLTAACDHVRLAEKGRFSRTGAPGVHVSGVEQHQDVFVIGMARLALAGVENPQLELGNALQRVPAGNPQRDGFDLALAVPPPGLRVSLSGLDHFPVQTSDGGGLFIQHVLSQLRPDGRAVILVPEGLLFRNSEQRLRRLLLDQHGVEAVIGMPESTFSPFMSIRTSLLVLRRNGPTRRIRMADAGPFFVKSTGNKPDTPAENRAAELVQCIRSPEPGQDCWDVDVAELAELDWDLTPKRRIQGELEGVLNELQPGVEIRPLEECCQIFSGQAFRKEELVDEAPFRFVDPEQNSYQPKQDAPTRNGTDIPAIPYIRIKDIQQGQATSGSSWLSPARASALDAKWKLKPGDVLLSKSGTIGKTGIVRNGGVGAVAANGLFVLRAEQSLIDPHFLLAYLESNACRAWFANHTRGTTILHLSGKTLQALPVPLPALPVQQRVVSECKARGGDALAILSQLLLESESDPVAQWLVQALLFLRRKHGSEGIVGDVSLLMHPHVFGESLEAVHASLARQETPPPLAPWLLAVSQAADALRSLDDIPPGTAAFSLLQQSVSLVRSAEALLTGHQPAENKARELTGLVAAVVEGAMTALVENVRVEVSAETGTLEKDATAHIEVRIANQGILPLRNMHVSTQPDWGGAQIGYLAEQADKTFSITGTPETHSETFSLHVSWSGLRMDGQPVEGKREIVFTVSKAQAALKNMLPDLGGSPYVCGDPVGPDNHEVFFGREDILEQIRRHILKSGNVVLLEGNRRSGKTSILKHLEGTSAIPGWVNVYCSFQKAKGADQSTGIPTVEVFRLITEGIAKAVFRHVDVTIALPNGESPPQSRKLNIRERKRFGLSAREAISDEMPFSDFCDYLQVVLEEVSARGLGLVLMLDEFDKLQEGIDNKITSPQVPENIRYAIQTFPGLTAILTGSRRLKRLREEYWSMLFGLGTRISVSYLSEDAARQLVTKPVQATLAFTQEAVQRALFLTACQPYLLQCLCNGIFDMALQTRSSRITLDHVNDAALKMVHNNEHFPTMWDYVQSERRRLILAIFQNSRQEPEPLSLGLLQERLYSHGIEVKDRDMINDLEFLRELELIAFVSGSSGGHYRLTIPMMGSWIEKTQDLEALKSKALLETEDHHA